MKKHLLFKFLISICLSLFLSVGWLKAQVSLPHHEAFDYAVADTLGVQATNWTNLYSGDSITVSSGSLSYPGLAISTGNKVSFDGAGKDSYLAFNSVLTGTVYASFIFKITDQSEITDLTDGGYFAVIADGTSLEARLWVRPNPDASSSTFDIGFGSMNFAPPTTSETFNVGDAIFVVMSYNIDNGAVSVWINPSFSSFGTTAPTATLTDTDASPAASISRFFLYQRSLEETPSIEFDELRIGTSWAEVTPKNTSDFAPQATFSPVNGLTDVLLGSDITITFDELIYKPGGVTEIVDGDLASLITFAETDANGTPVPATMTYSNADPFVITINPTAELASNQAYYVAFSSVFDNLGQENTGESITFTTELGYIPIASAYAISDDEIEVTYESSLTAAVAAEYNLTGTAAITFSTATIDATDDKIVHLSGASATITGDATVDNIADANTNTNLYAGVLPIAYTNANNANGTISEDIIATFKGIVSGNDATNHVWVSDAVGVFNGILINDIDFQALVAVGDEVLFRGVLDINNNLSEIINPTWIETITQGNSLYGPSVINGADISDAIAADTDPAEGWEGQLIKIVNATITADIDDSDYFYTATDDAGATSFRIGDAVDFQLENIALTLNDQITITGIGDYEDGAYRINPRSMFDIVSASDTISSTEYTIDNTAGTIVDIASSTDLATFKSNIVVCDSASAEVYQADGSTVATDLQTDYKFIVTAADGITTKTYTITITVGTNNLFSNANIKLYPNPSNGLVTLELNNTNNEEFFIEVYNVIGETVYKTSVSCNRKNIDLTKLNTGIYYVSINKGDDKKVSKIVIK